MGDLAKTISQKKATSVDVNNKATPAKKTQPKEKRRLKLGFKFSDTVILISHTI